MTARRLTALAMLAGLGHDLSGRPPRSRAIAAHAARIIDNFEQRGIDTATPRFGWVVNDPG